MVLNPNPTMNMTPEYNLVDEPWIPVRWQSGKQEQLGLAELFRNAEDISDLVCAPHERISLMRLLICITQTVFPPPETDEDWDGYAESMATRIPEYLNHDDIKPHFNLLGEGPRFLQVQVPPQKVPTPVSKLIPHLATGNNTTLNDHLGDDKIARRISPAEIALALLTFQNFYPLYGAGYKGKGPCVDRDMLHTLILGSTLLENIINNCLTEEMIHAAFSGGIGGAIWELNATMDNFEEMACHSYLGRLAPRHRNIWLCDSLSGFYIEKNAMTYPGFPDFREPTATATVVKKNKESVRRLLSAQLNRGIWRDLHLITAIREAEHEDARAPLTLQAHWYEHDEEPHLWLGALITDRKAKIYDTVESTLSIPRSMFRGRGRAVYQAGLEFAELASRKIWSSVKTYGSELMIDSPPTGVAQKVFWSRMDQHAQKLIDLVKCVETRTESFGWGNDPWTLAVQQAALEAYQSTCPRSTPRQLKAYAAGLRNLRIKKSSKNKSETEK